MLKRTFAIVTALSLAMATSGHAFASTGTSGSVIAGGKHAVITVASKDSKADSKGSPDKGADKGSLDKASPDKPSLDKPSPDNNSNDKVIIDG